MAWKANLVSLQSLLCAKVKTQAASMKFLKSCLLPYLYKSYYGVVSFLQVAKPQFLTEILNVVFCQALTMPQSSNFAKRIWPCGGCKRWFKSERGRGHHARDKNHHVYSCEPCNRHFATQELLDQHYLYSPIHDNRCDACDRQFATRLGYYQHRRQSGRHV